MEQKSNPVEGERWLLEEFAIATAEKIAAKPIDDWAQIVEDAIKEWTAATPPTESQGELARALNLLQGLVTEIYSHAGVAVEALDWSVFNEAEKLVRQYTDNIYSEIKLTPQPKVDRLREKLEKGFRLFDRGDTGDEDFIQFVRNALAAAPASLEPKVEESRLRDGIYIASKTRHAERWKTLRQQGAPIISTWIDEAGPGESDSLTDLWLRCIREATCANALILYAEPGDVLKGAFIEAGSAIASGVPVFAVGIDDLSICNHPGVTICQSFDEALRNALAASPTETEPKVDQREEEEKNAAR